MKRRIILPLAALLLPPAATLPKWANMTQHPGEELMLVTEGRGWIA